MLRIGVVAGEASGDQLGAGLIRAIAQSRPDAVFEGVAGPLMARAGCRVIVPAEKLAVMGIVEVLRHYRELRAIRADLARHFLAARPDVFIGIDAPDFNLGLELRLRRAGIATVHYVSPSVWAWRRSRVRKIARAVDLMLTLFPFEADFYRRSGVGVCFVGHPLADTLPLQPDRGAARQALALPDQPTVIALLPGSRLSEVAQLAPLFIAAAARCLEKHPGLRFVVPLVNGAVRARFEQALVASGRELPVTLIDGRAHEVMAAADLVLVASGTATLEAMLLKRPMVVAYRVAPLTHFLLKRMVRIRRFALPNLLADRDLVPEFIQHDATPDNLAGALLDYLENPGRVDALSAAFAHLHLALRQGASERAAAAILALAGRKNVTGADERRG